ncbi:c6 transcription protein [Diplodia corticola]|uniref:C6 transcription protein n=1 Tax=Diplodia corticola TaxID=236234 RepID=A0A1J9RVA7_9PEZI|nr:c6 transcription protein [Diplodia corticola]OJD31437.1 c6 transcription protein [Diplodia corticola]
MPDALEDSYRARRPHRKSRNGCRNCKARKIKCDEVQPQCGQCTKHAVICDFSARESLPASSVSSSTTTTPAPTFSGIDSTLLNLDPPTAPPPTTSLAADERYNNNIDDDNNSHNSAWRRLFGAPSDPIDQLAVATSSIPLEPDLELNMTDLELLHHFTVTTAYTLGATVELQTWWRIEVPHLAFSYPFVMRALLALSGVHVAHTILSSSPPPTTTDRNDSPTASEERRLQAADHTARALSQQRLALRTAHALLPSCTTTATTESSSFPSAGIHASPPSLTSWPHPSLNPHIFPPLYICAVITTLASFAAAAATASPQQQQHHHDEIRDTDANNNKNDLLIVNISNSDNNSGSATTTGTIAPWLLLSRGIKQAADRAAAAAAGVPQPGRPEGGGGGGVEPGSLAGGRRREGRGSNSNSNSNNNTALLMANAVGMPLRISQPRYGGGGGGRATTLGRGRGKPEGEEGEEEPGGGGSGGGGDYSSSSLWYDPCHGWSTSARRSRSRSRSGGGGVGVMDDGGSGRRRTGAGELHAAVTAGIDQLAALRAWFVALYEQRYRRRHRHMRPHRHHRRSANDGDDYDDDDDNDDYETMEGQEGGGGGGGGGGGRAEEEEDEEAAAAAADEANLSSLVAAIDGLMEAYAVFDESEKGRDRRRWERDGGGGDADEGDDDMTAGMRAVLGWVCNSSTGNGGGNGGGAASVDDRFLERAAQGAPAFLIVLAFWGVLIHWVDDGGGGGDGSGVGVSGRQNTQRRRCWWIGGWGRRLVRRVEMAVSVQGSASEGDRAMHGGGDMEKESEMDWLRWLRWPLEQVVTDGKSGGVRAVDCVVI